MRTARTWTVGLLGIGALTGCGDGSDNGSAAATGECNGDSPIVALDTDTTGEDGALQVYVVDADGEVDRITGDWVASHASFAPDGDRLVLVRADGNYESAGPNSTALWVMGIDGTEPRALTSGEVLDEDPDWSPDGAHILFARARLTADGWARSIEVVPADGGEPTQLLAVEGDNLEHPAWSPDGRQVAFVRTVFRTDAPVDQTTVWTMGADGRDPRPVVDLPYARSLDWSPDGRSLLVVGGDPFTLHQVDVTSGAITPLADGVQMAAWAPDGASIYYLPALDADRRTQTLWEGHIADGRLVADRQVPTDGLAIDVGFRLSTGPCA